MNLRDTSQGALIDTDTGAQYEFNLVSGYWENLATGAIPDQTAFPPLHLPLHVNSDGTLTLNYGGNFINADTDYAWNASLGVWQGVQTGNIPDQTYFPAGPVSAAAAGTTITVTSSTPGTTNSVVLLALAAGAAWLLFGKKSA